MPARTGAQFLAGLKDDREVWVDGERVRDVAKITRRSRARRD